MPFNSIMGFGDQLFTVLVLILAAGVSAHMAHGYGTRKSKEMFVMLLLLLMVGVQFFHLINAAVYVPATKFYVWNPKLHRTDCINSGKGGKRNGTGSALEDLNPCFCLSSPSIPGVTCTTKGTGMPLLTGSCPTDGTAKCRQGSKRVHRFVPNLRSCQGGQATTCTKTSPCYPCERSTLAAFGQGRCRSCSTQNTGECHFVPHEGPYCYKTPGSKEIEPCKQCCTEPEPLIQNSTCY